MDMAAYGAIMERFQEILLLADFQFTDSPIPVVVVLPGDHTVVHELLDNTHHLSDAQTVLREQILVPHPLAIVLDKFNHIQLDSHRSPGYLPQITCLARRLAEKKAPHP
jgi:hypothetical protein